MIASNPFIPYIPAKVLPIIALVGSSSPSVAVQSSFKPPTKSPFNTFCLNPCKLYFSITSLTWPVPADNLVKILFNDVPALPPLINLSPISPSAIPTSSTFMPRIPATEEELVSACPNCSTFVPLLLATLANTSAKCPASLASIPKALSPFETISALRAKDIFPTVLRAITFAILSYTC